MAEGTMSTGRLVRRSLLAFAGLALLTAALTTLFLSMRAVMEIGGACASGNTPFEIRSPCPKGTGGLMVFSILGGLVFLGVYAVNTFVLNLAALAWPALFLSLGYNFFDYGINPPEAAGSGASVGWIICGVVFVLMGGVPLAIGIGALLQQKDSKLAKAVSKSDALDASRLRSGLRRGSVKRAGAPTTTATRERGVRTGDGPREHSWSVIDSLERLAAMHKRGELDDDEYETAKEQVLADEERS